MMNELGLKRTLAVVNQVEAQCAGFTPQLLRSQAAGTPAAIAKGKAAIQATQQLPLTKGLGYELEQVMKLMATPDRVEGMQAFIEKRRPVFTG